MILDNIKDLIKEMEEVLIKDPRFKEDMYFKNMVKTIYINNSTKLKTINEMPSYDITPIVLANLSHLGKSYGDTKSTEVIKVKSDCDKVINDLKLVIDELIKEVKKAYDAAGGINSESKEKLAEVERLFKSGKINEAIALAKSR